MIVYTKIMLAKFTSCKWQGVINYLMEGGEKVKAWKELCCVKWKCQGKRITQPQVCPERENMAGFVLILKEIWETINIKETIAELPNCQEKTNRISIN